MSIAIVAVSLAACGSDNSSSGSATTVAASASVATTAAAASATTTAAAPTKVKLTLEWVTQAEFAGFYAAQELGYYKDENIDLQIQPGGPDINSIQLLLSGDTDIAIQSFGDVLAARDSGADVVNIGQLFERAGYRLVSFADEGISGADQFKGKKVGLWSGFSSSFSAAAAKHGLDIDKDVTIFNQGFDMEAFLTGQIDLASTMTYNEYAQALAGAGGRPLQVFDFNQDGTSTLEDALIATPAWLKANPAATEGFLRATAKGWIYCRDHAAECVQMVLKNGTALPENFQTWQMNEINKLIWPSTSGFMELTPPMFQQTADILLKYGVIKTAATAASYDMSYRDKALASLSQDDPLGKSYTPLALDPAVLFKS